MVRDVDGRVAEFRVRVALLNVETALGHPCHECPGVSLSGKKGSPATSGFSQQSLAGWQKQQSGILQHQNFPCSRSVAFGSSPPRMARRARPSVARWRRISRPFRVGFALACRPCHRGRHATDDDAAPVNVPQQGNPNRRIRLVSQKPPSVTQPGRRSRRRVSPDNSRICATMWLWACEAKIRPAGARYYNPVQVSSA